VAEPVGHVVAAAGTAAFTKPAGYASLKESPLSETDDGAVLAIVNVKSDVAPGTVAAGANTLAIVTFGATIDRFALAGALFDAVCVVVSALTGIVFV
jgi:hypothetical protein